MDKQLVVRLDPEVFAALKSKSALDFVAMSDVVRWAIDDYLSGKWKLRPRDRRVKDGKH